MLSNSIYFSIMFAMLFLPAQFDYFMYFMANQINKPCKIIILNSCAGSTLFNKKKDRKLVSLLLGYLNFRVSFHAQRPLVDPGLIKAGMLSNQCFSN